MEQNPPVLAKKVWSLMRGVYMTLRKGLSKKKLILDLNILVKRGKISGKTVQNVMLFQQQQRQRQQRLEVVPPSPGEYEFRCTNDRFSLFSKKHKPSEDLPVMIQSETGSPTLPGLGGSPMFIRVSDSPFPMSEVEDSHVDEAADRFINRFYDGLRRENANAPSGSS